LQRAHIGKVTPTDMLIYLKRLEEGEIRYGGRYANLRGRVAHGKLKRTQNDLLHLMQRLRSEGVEICTTSNDVDKIADS